MEITHFLALLLNSLTNSIYGMTMIKETVFESIQNYEEFFSIETDVNLLI